MIDAHQHFWRLADGWYDWLTPAAEPIYRDYGPEDFRPLAKEAGVEATVLVQAAAAADETRSMLALSDRAPLVAAVVGWVEMDGPRGLEQLAEFSVHPKFRGIRPMLQDIAETDWILRREFEPVLRRLVELGLCFDALVTPRHFGALKQFVARWPDLAIVVDHAAKPAIRNGPSAFAPWAREMASLAEFPNVSCKLSGLLTEAGPGAGDAELAPYADHILSCFGASRVMWGSDWPVLNMASSYGEWLAMAQRLLAERSPEERDQVFGGTARRFYGI